MNGDDGRHPNPQRRGVGRREENIESIRGGGPRQAHLFPPGTPRTRDDACGEAMRIELDAQTIGRVQNEVVTPRQAVGCPFLQEPAQVPAGTRRTADELARVYADPHCRCAIAR